MDSHKMHKLAERFWQGACTEQEEQQLKQALSFGKIPEGLEPLADYFRSLEDQKSQLVLDTSFDEVLLAEVAERRQAKTRPMFFMRMAAGLALIVGLSYTALTLLSPDPPQSVEVAIVDTYEDPEVAFREVKRALMKVSTNLNSGLEPTIKLGEFHKAKETISN